MQNILALDFDGVICDSAAEMAHSSWRAARRLWPERYAQAPSPAHIFAFRHVRPVVETGFQGILLTELLVRGLPHREILVDFAAKCRELMVELKVDKKVLIDCFGVVRDQWIATDLESWIATHAFYPGVVEALNQATSLKAIITTKQKRFTLALCRAAGLHIPDDLVFGLEAGRKEDVLAGLASRFDPCRLHFVEDRLRTLERVARLKDRTDLRLYFARWGFNTAAERRRAGNMTQISSLDLANFAHFTANPPA